ncbi:MAG TPA: zinc-ribbon domain-containing protein [Bryobacteraceae bacterium]|nr:zinc-ribbon domain-containing protein [Bryobacteraceae bacterium]
MFCHHCGTQVSDAAQFCTNCGQPLTAAASVAVAPAPWTPPARVEASAGRWIGAGWDLVKGDLATYVLMALMFFLLSSIPLIQGALIAGIHIFTMKKLAGRRAEFVDLFKGFNFFVHTLIASILIAVFVFLGTLALIIPGLVIAAMYKFTYLFIVDKHMEFWPAMKASHAVVRNDYLGFTWFLILAFLVNVLGFLCLLVGLLVTVPVTIAAITVAYREVVGFEPATADSL